MAEKSVRIAFFVWRIMAKLWDCLKLAKQLELAERFNLPVEIVETKWGRRCYLRGQIEVEEEFAEIEQIMQSNTGVYKKQLLKYG